MTAFKMIIKLNEHLSKTAFDINSAFTELGFFADCLTLKKWLNKY